MIKLQHSHIVLFILALLLLCVKPHNSHAAPINISQDPLFLTQAVPPLTMLVLGRNHKLYYEAYNDSSDLNGDGVLDTTYKPNDIDYYGYFDSYKCYDYNSGGKYFYPVSTNTNKICGGTHWSGDFLNYLTTARIDALRKVLYGGFRSTDTSSETILERAYIPQDAHSWGKEYSSMATNGYSIANRSPLTPPTAGNYILFANTTILGGSGEPILRVAYNVPYRVWEWLSIERPVAGNDVATGNNSRTNISGSITDYVVRVKVCDPGVGLEANCRLYPSGHYKPIGLLQEFGENNSMKFGLLSGSYANNLQGGVLRKNIGEITDEINATTGQFNSTVGIVKTIDRLRVTGFASSHYYNSNCGWITTRPLNNGECSMWGNPVAEMMYESLRYFAGKSGPTSAFDYSSGDDVTLGLPKASWSDPYNTSANPWCAKPNMLVISDINPSYDSDQVPGTSFGSFTGDLTGLNVTTLGQTIWTNEVGSAVMRFIGQVGALADNAPTAKLVSSFGNIRGLAPEEPGANGSYYAAAVAYYGWLNDISAATNDQLVHTFVVALASQLPEINIPVNGQTITLVPFAKSVGGCLGVNGTQGLFQPTNTIVDFYVESITPTSGTFRINFEDVQQGADHDMDAIVTYNYVVNPDNTVTVTLNSTYAAGCIIQHMGYVISGTTADGTYLEVRDSDTGSGSDADYFLDTPNVPGALPLTAVRTFTPSATPAASILKSPLWFAAKWGSFNDKNNNNVPDDAKEFDADANGTPDNYFLVTNALNLSNQIISAFKSILKRTSSAASAAVNTGSLSAGTEIYQAVFNSATWTGQLLAYPLDPATGAIVTTGSGPNGSKWDAGALIGSLNWNTGRKILTYKPSTKAGVAFRWPANAASPTTTEIDVAQVALLNLNPQTSTVDTEGEARLEYIRGSQTKELQNGGAYRNRSTLLGDIINSAPYYVGIPAFPYQDTWPGSAPENSSPYSTFRNTYKNRVPIIYTGANDGMLHGFDAATGVEKIAYVPNAIFSKLNQLPFADYVHSFYVDGSVNVVDVFYNSGWHTVLIAGLNAGGQGIYALDVTDPSAFNETNAATIVMWEFTDADDADMGFSYSQPALVRLQNGKWGAIFGNGLNNTQADANVSTTGNSVIYIVDIETGAIIKKFDTLIGTADDPESLGRPNGMATPAIVDTNGDFIADYVYAGDLFGNVWKLDITDADPNNWKFAFLETNGDPKPFYTAKDGNGKNQPITSRINVAKIPGQVAGLQIFFGTGKYLEVADKTNLDVQTFYGLRDFNTTAIAGRADLLQQTILAEISFTHPDSTVSEYRITSDNALQPSDRGWYLDLILNTNAQGERVVSDPIVRNEKVIFSTLIPSNDPCGFGGTGWLMELSFTNGSRLASSPFDTNQDGTFTTGDNVTYTDGGGNTVTVPVSGIKSKVGLIPTASIISDKEIEHKYIPGTSGQIQHITENPGKNVHGRQSWRQLR